MLYAQASKFIKEKLEKSGLHLENNVKASARDRAYLNITAKIGDMSKTLSKYSPKCIQVPPSPPSSPPPPLLPPVLYSDLDS